MIFAVIGIIVIGILGTVFLKKKPHPLLQKVHALELYINKKLSLEESYLFLDMVRSITLDLIPLSQQKNQLKEITNKLLGFVLTVPRINENTDDADPITQAIYQIEVVLQTTSETQEYIQKNHAILVKLLNNI